MIRTIRDLRRLCPDARLGPFVGLVIGYALAQGASLLAVIPVVGAVMAGDVRGGWCAVAVLLSFAAAATALFFFQAKAGYRASLRIVRGLQQRVGDHAARLPVGWFSRARSGELSQIASKNAEDVGAVTAHLLQPVVSAVLGPLVVVVGLLCWDVRVALVGALFLPLAALIGWLVPAFSRRVDAERDRSTTRVNEQVIDFALAQQVLRSAGRGPGAYPPLDDALESDYLTQRRALRKVVPGTLLNTVSVQVWLVLLLATTVALALTGEMAVPVAAGLLIIAVRFVGPLTELSEYATALRGAGDSLSKISQFLGERPLPEPAAPVSIGTSALAISFDDVRFSYEERRVLDGVSVELAPGTLTALVGRSGAGKTTILRLLSRFWDVDAGAIRIDGVDVREIGSVGVIDRVAVVFQDVFLFEGSILENVRVGRPDADDAQVRDAIIRARVQEIADRLPDGLDTAVGEGGARLSGGERQRVSIARALLKDAPIVLLDEATASVDAMNESALADAFRELARGRTVIAIAHRLATVREADRILVLEDGAIVEDGDHEELIAIDGRYADFWRATEDAAHWRLGESAAPRG